MNGFIKTSILYMRFKPLETVLNSPVFTLYMK